MRVSIWTVLFLAISSLASAATYDFYPGIPLHLGSSFDPTDFSAAYAPCLFFEDEMPLDVKKGVSDTVGIETDFTLNQITSRRQLYRYLSISASVSGHYSLFQGGGASIYRRRISSTVTILLGLYGSILNTASSA
jgi:hypothetical protein